MKRYYVQLLEAYRSGSHTAAATGEVDEVNGKIVSDAVPKKLIPELPAKRNSQVVMLGLVCWLP